MDNLIDLRGTTSSENVGEAARGLGPFPAAEMLLRGAGGLNVQTVPPDCLRPTHVLISGQHRDQTRLAEPAFGRLADRLGAEISVRHHRKQCEWDACSQATLHGGRYWVEAAQTVVDSAEMV